MIAVNKPARTHAHAHTHTHTPTQHIGASSLFISCAPTQWHSVRRVGGPPPRATQSWGSATKRPQHCGEPTRNPDVTGVLAVRGVLIICAAAPRPGLRGWRDSRLAPRLRESTYGNSGQGCAGRSKRTITTCLLNPDPTQPGGSPAVDRAGRAERRIPRGPAGTRRDDELADRAVPAWCRVCGGVVSTRVALG